MDKIEWKEIEVEASQLKPFEGNPRTITQEVTDGIKYSLEKFGQAIPLQVDTDFTVLGGNQRMKQLKGKVRVMYPSRELSQTERLEIVLSANQKAGNWDFLKLEDMGFRDDELIKMGFDSEAINELGFDFDDIDFEEFDDAKVIKKLIINFSGYDVKNLIAGAKNKYGHADLENVLLDMCKEYEQDNS